MNDVLRLHLIVLIWGISSILGILIHIPAAEVVFFRTLFTSCLLLLVFYWKKLPFLHVKKNDLLCFTTAGIFIALHWIFFFTSARVANASISVVGLATSALWTALLAPFIEKRRLRLYEIFFSLVVVFGLYLIYKESVHFLGLSLSVISAFFGALFTMSNAQWGNKEHFLVVTFYEMISASLFTLIYLLVLHFSKSSSLDLHPSSQDLFYLLLLTYFCTYVGMTNSIQLVQRLSAFQVNLTCNLEPLYGIILAYFLLGEDDQLNMDFYVGGVIILVSVILYGVIEGREMEKRKGKKTSQASINENPHTHRKTISMVLPSETLPESPSNERDLLEEKSTA